MELINTVTIAGSKGKAVRLTFGDHLAGVNVELDYSGRITTYTASYFADVISALILGVDHVEDLPEYCQCENCRTTRGKAFAERLAAAQAERLRTIEEQRQEGCF
jgi:hypothetical protein